jgi:hypothetical protein
MNVNELKCSVVTANCTITLEFSLDENSYINLLQGLKLAIKKLLYSKLKIV